MKKACSRRLTPIQKKEMRDLFLNGYAISYIARMFDCRPVAVWNNVFDIDPPTTFSKTRQAWALNASKISVSDVKRIRSKVKQGISSGVAAKLYGISESAALAIIRGKTFRWVPGWTRPYTDRLVYLDPIDLPKETKKTDLVRGCKLGSFHTVESGALIKQAKKYNVSTSTICRWRQKGKIKI
jgi:hypothetical protein